MSNTEINLRHKIDTAANLQGVVRTMKALAASNISQYETSVLALADYYRTIELGLSASFNAENTINIDDQAQLSNYSPTTTDNSICLILFGSDQGLVGKFNEEIASFALSTIDKHQEKPVFWVIGERLKNHLHEVGLNIAKSFSVPTSIKAVTDLVVAMQIESESESERHNVNTHNNQNSILFSASRVVVFHNYPTSGAQYKSVSQPLLPLDSAWQRKISKVLWPTNAIPEILCSNNQTLRSLIREFIYISLFRACTESLASENLSRLSAMQRAEKNIDELLEALAQEFHQIRQGTIDEELFDVIAGYRLLVDEIL